MFARLATLSGWRADGAALGLGALATAALPPVYAIPVLLVATPGLLALIDGAVGPGLAARRGWWFGFGNNLLGLYWITEAILVEAARFWWLVPLAVPGLAAVMALFVAAPAGLSRLARRGWPRVFALAGGWVLADLARQFIATGFPWNPWGSVWEMPGSAGEVMIQPAAWIGAPGLTVLTVLLSALPALGWRWRIGGAAVLVGWAGVGFVRLATPLPAPPELKVVLVQGNIAEGQKWDRALMMRIFDHYLDLTREGIVRAGGAPAVVVWPETASPFLLQTDAAARAAISEAADSGAAGSTAAGAGRPASGTASSGSATSGAAASGAASSEAIGSGAAGKTPALVGAVRFGPDDWPRNSLFAVLPGGRLAKGEDGIYDKWHLVPFGEYQPGWFPLPFQVVPGGGFRPGPGPRTLHLANLPPVGPLICYEAIFPGQVVDAADRPVWLVNITNDAWFGNSTGPRQHLAAARLRAVEEGLPLMRAANTGISAAFDPRGHELARLGMDRAGVLVVDLPAALPTTMFARFGLLIPGIIGCIALGAGLAAPGRVAFGTRRAKN
jgi:apolipoprotein N-acyltransferase